MHRNWGRVSAIIQNNIAIVRSLLSENILRRCVQKSGIIQKIILRGYLCEWIPKFLCYILFRFELNFCCFIMSYWCAFLIQLFRTCVRRMMSLLNLANIPNEMISGSDQKWAWLDNKSICWNVFVRIITGFSILSGKCRKWRYFERNNSRIIKDGERRHTTLMLFDCYGK